ncbi:MAG: Flp pilus assembly complex ATPase component TadA [Verrucomicrobiales bacterium]|nr:Flp pilus assembly complex ATPase component TadA [Verrucomicrobiales bacterium]
MSLIPLLTRLSLNSGCADSMRCESILAEAAGKHSSLIDALLDANIVDEESFAAQLAEEAGLDFVLEPEMDDSTTLHRQFPAKVALRHRILPVARVEGGLMLLTYDPFDLEARQAVGREWPKPVTWAVGTRYRILEGLRQGYGVGAEQFDELIEGRDPNAEDDFEQEVTQLDEEEEEASVMNFVNQIFREALRERATDIHIEPLEKNLRIRYRIDGALQEVTVPPDIRALQASLVSRLKIMAQLDIAERRLPQDGRINLELDGNPVDVRVATIPSVNGESVSLRLLTRQNFDMDMLGLDAETRTLIEGLLKHPNGIILVTGPTGSGKSTTLYTFLKQLNTKDTRIVTVEDPVENRLDGVVQIAMRPEIGLTFATGLRAILRGDPNIIMVGEMRDLETTEIAIRGALTGHLVFSTLHTNDAVSGITRLLDMGVEPFLIASSVRAFLAQRLVRKLCDECKKPAELEDSYLTEVGFPLEKKSGIHEAGGCRACRNTGYRGRMAILEICVIEPKLSELITSNAPYSELKKRSLENGMVTLRNYGWNKVAQGQTTIEEVLSNVDQ